jgi:hypothetical protein
MAFLKTGDAPIEKILCKCGTEINKDMTECPGCKSTIPRDNVCCGQCQCKVIPPDAEDPKPTV